MTPLVRALLGAAAALPVAAQAQVIRPVTPPPTVAVPLPIVTVTVQYPPPLTTTPSLPSPIQTPTIVLSVPDSTAASPNAERAVETGAADASPNPTGDQTRAEPGDPIVVPPEDKGQGADGDGEECDNEQGNATGNPNACPDNEAAAAKTAEPARAVALDWYAIALLLACAALVIFWIRSLLRR
jgi:hypothetical protein